MIGINNISVEFSAKPLFNDISFTINDTDRVALVGKNGAGKSTLLKIIAGIQSPNSGNVSLPSNIKIGYLPQEMVTVDDTTLIAEARKAFKEKINLEKKLANLEDKIANFDDHNSQDYFDLLTEADELRNSILVRFPETTDALIQRTLIGLGFKQTDFNRDTSEFSGGWRMRIELAKILLQQPDLLLLDEPTNHLDINSIRWLEQFLAAYSGAVVLISHDRAFLDNVTKRTVEISCGKIYDYKVPYSLFKELRKERIEQQTRTYENQQKLIAETKDFIERFRYKATKAVQVQSRIKQLEKIIPIEIDEEDNSKVNFKFPPAERSGDFPLIAQELSKSYGDHLVFANADITIRRGEKIAFVGSNGEGKSTFVKCIMDEIPYTGHLKIGHNIKISYFAQNQAQLLDKTKTVFDTVDYVATGDIRTRLKDFLAAFLFRGEDIEKKVEVLSGGEKTRLAMAKLLLEPANFLILDEPTNHLDLRTKDVLKRAIKDFTGTVIIVSHDRDFLDGLVDKVYEFANGKVREHIGGIYSYLNQRDAERSIETKPKNIDNEVATPSKNKISYQEKKQFEKLLRKAQKKVEEVESAIESLELLIQNIEEKLARGEINDDLLKEYAEKKQSMEDLTSQWEEAQNELDNLKQNEP